MSEAATIATIYRYPVKGLSAEPLARVALAPRECLLHDRRFAIALAATRFDPERPEWLSKTHFIMLMRDEKLARLKTSFDPQTGELTIEHAGIVAVQARLGEPEGCRVVSEFLADFLGPAVEGPLRVVEAAGHAFADARDRKSTRLNSSHGYISYA